MRKYQSRMYEVSSKMICFHVYRNETNLMNTTLTKCQKKVQLFFSPSNLDEKRNQCHSFLQFADIIHRNIHFVKYNLITL